MGLGGGGAGDRGGGQQAGRGHAPPHNTPPFRRRQLEPGSVARHPGLKKGEMIASGLREGVVLWSGANQKLEEGKTERGGRVLDSSQTAQGRQHTPERGEGQREQDAHDSPAALHAPL